MAKNAVTLTFLGDADQLTKTFDKVGHDAKGMAKDVDTAGKKSSDAGKGMLTMGKAAAAGGALIAADFVKKGLSFAITEAREAEKVTKATEAAIKSTGGAAKISAGDIGKLSESLSRKIGVDDEAIQSSANMLLSYQHVRNEAGKGNDVFSRATALTQDYAAKMGVDATAAAKKMGAALNDPIKGSSSLAKAGVLLDDSTKKQIKSLVEHGDKLGAQKILLDASAKTFGGAAEAQATSADKLKVTFGNLAEKVGAFLIPIIDKCAAFFNKLIGEMQDGTGTGGKIAKVLGDIAKVLKAVWDAIWPVIQRLVKFQVELIALGVKIGKFIVGAVADFVGFVKNVKEQFDKVKNAITEPIGDAFSFIKGKFGDIVDLASDLPKRIARVVSGLFNSIPAGFKAAWNAVAGMVNSVTDFKINLPGPLPDLHINFPNLPKFHQGGIVPGVPGSEQLALLQAGERVQTKAQQSVKQESQPSKGGFRDIIFTGNIGSQRAARVAAFQLAHALRYS